MNLFPVNIKFKEVTLPIRNFPAAWSGNKLIIYVQYSVFSVYTQSIYLRTK